MVTDDIADAMISAPQMIYASRMKKRILYHICNANISYGNAVYHTANGDISLKNETFYDIIPIERRCFYV